MRRYLRNRFGYRLFTYRTLLAHAVRGEIGARKLRTVAFALSGGAIPLFQGGGPEPTMTTTAAVIAGRVVEISGDRSIRHAQSASQKVVGVAKQSGDAVGDKLSVSTSGVWPLVAQGAIAAGDTVVVGAANTGTVSTLAAAGAAYVQAEANATRAIVGIALAAAIDGATCPVLLKFA